MINNALILCAGFGTRMGTMSRSLPKPMIKVHGKPILQYIVENLHNQGIKNIHINLHYFPDIITNYFGDGGEFGVKITYHFEEKLLGTGGTTKKLFLTHSEIDKLLIIYGDVITKEVFSRLDNMLKRTDTVASLFLHKRDYSNSIVQMNEDSIINLFIERPKDKVLPSPNNFVNSGIQLLSRKALDFFPDDDVFDLPKDFYGKVFKKDILSGVTLKSKRVSVDTPERLSKAKKLFGGLDG